MDPARDGEDLPCALYLQGGPGGQGAPPGRHLGWLGRALESYRVILPRPAGHGPQLAHRRPG
ncbi:hypothetical protein [Nonomuraea rubra]|uniref:hypothetical protein n=1 Tax=Nonomuraea rubra TaxID=46180 RepID=UPI0031E743A0